MGKRPLSQTSFKNHAKQRWGVLPIAVKALVQNYHKAERPCPAMGSLSHRWEPSDGKGIPLMGRHDRWWSLKVDSFLVWKSTSHPAMGSLYPSMGR
ncbi:unnamed protein product [Cuscuta campestris]|uniref:Uncharacterized protein n=1 Tax=Cuscuta campestris TaxID=132261 RepID=A0A484NEG1_9ASTE|nr:unnamed protein product [Cuscuta campestris]